jgi:hypothetical protein
MATRQQEQEIPRSVSRGPLITLTCECGQRKELHYGEQWKCMDCGRRYDTRKIPLDEYAAIRRTQIRYRLFPLITGVLLLIAVVIFFIAGRAFAGLIAIPFLLASWGIFGRPFYRARYRKSLGKNLPEWNIKAD